MKEITNLRQLRLSKFMTQMELSKLTGIPNPTLSRYESKERNPKPENLIKIADALGVSLEEVDSCFNRKIRVDINEDVLRKKLIKLAGPHGYSLDIAYQIEEIMTYVKGEKPMPKSKFIETMVEVLSGDNK
jgi:transcriptional regulator with XRE-family HTH domain